LRDLGYDVPYSLMTVTNVTNGRDWPVIVTLRSLANEADRFGIARSEDDLISAVKATLDSLNRSSRPSKVAPSHRVLDALLRGVTRRTCDLAVGQSRVRSDPPSVAAIPRRRRPRRAATPQRVMRSRAMTVPCTRALRAASSTDWTSTSSRVDDGILVLSMLEGTKVADHLDRVASHVDGGAAMSSHVTGWVGS